MRGGLRPAKNLLLTAKALDGRTHARKAYDGIVANITSDLGGRDQLSTIENTLVAAFAGVAVHVGDLNAKLLRGDHIDLGEHAVAVSSLVRIASRLGVHRRPREVASLDHCLRSNRHIDADDDTLEAAE
jgi:hypothetical protein